MPTVSYGSEFERQVENLVSRCYFAQAELTAEMTAEKTEERFRRLLEPLRRLLPAADSPAPGSIPFVLVASSELVPAYIGVKLVERAGKRGFSVLEEDELGLFTPIGQVELPAGAAYLLLDVDTGARMKNVTPNDALEMISGEGRSPLTVEEGVALLTHFPEVVSRNNGFSLLGSRCGDKRVTAWWISEGRPKLGWCWAGNPHGWLGSASCGARLALPD